MYQMEGWLEALQVEVEHPQVHSFATMWLCECAYMSVCVNVWVSECVVCVRECVLVL